MTSLETHEGQLPRWQSRLLPGDHVVADSDTRTARDWVVDTIVFVLALAVGVLALAAAWNDHGPAAALGDIVLGLAACLALWRRRRHPIGFAFFAVGAAGVASMAGGAGLVGLFTAALRGTRRELSWIVGLALVGFLVNPLLYPSSGPYPEQVLIGLLFLSVAITVGLFARARRELVVSLHDRAERVEAEQRMQVAQAREAERRRIAREMHDVLAHRLSLLSVHAGALEFHPDAPAAEISQAAGVIRETAQSALQELREVIGVLRDDEGDAAVEPPQPTLAQIPALLEESRAAGMRVESRVEVPHADEIPDALGRTAYRVVQEGLTNARKHAPGVAVEVAIFQTDAPALVVQVISRAPIAGHAESLPGTGSGLVGLTERVTLAGGGLSSGPDARGDFVLRATLPWTAA